jgi:tRNA-specific 2-thiouridylase
MKIGVALSGGRDSSLTAALLRKEGHEVAAFHLLLSPADSSPVSRERQIRAVEELSSRLGIRLTVLDLAARFEAEIIAPFLAEYDRGRTPSPCVFCNPLFKFGYLLEAVLAAGCARLASGHFARVVPGERPLLKKNLDPIRDESYFLHRLDARRLSRALLPLGEIPQAETDRLTAELLPGFQPLPSSVEACFLGAGRFGDFLRLRRPLRPGEIVDKEGRVLGVHPGHQLYTIGQRRGLSSASGKKGPLYVTAVDTGNNRVVVGNKADLLSSSLIAREPNWIAIDPPDKPLRALAKIRYTHLGAEAEVIPLASGEIKVVFDRPQEAITPGQAVVFYRGDVVLGGAWIEKKL